ncbi:MAG: serine/threonine protein kinase [Deltaproteobacteria bacterium]|nr:serine/threonine protein kinase [Deltaproteobacteria bacterium]
MAGSTMTVAHASVGVVPSARPRRRRCRATLLEGNRVGPWRVERELGRGGMASVYAVAHTQFGKRAALKIAHRSVIGPDFTSATFLREARIVHLVDHPGVPDVFATGSYDGRPYLAMERLTGKTLGQLLDTGALSRVDAIGYLLELCEVLGVAHAAGIVHRDLKLDNVFVEATPGSGGRRVRLLDWGVARILGEDDPMRGMLAGTVSYVAPEQVRGDEITPAADLYSLAVLAYHTLLGSPPFVGDHELELIRMHLHATPPAPASLWPEVPAELASLLTAMLDKDPAHRPTLDEIVRVLRAVAEHLEPRRRSWLASMSAVPALPPIDVLGRPAPLALAAIRQRLVGATLAVALAIASVVSLLSA